MIGKTLGHYRVGEQLGRGGMGEVYQADDLNLNRKVALKFLPEAFAGDPERMARFEREAKLLASLNHNNIAAIYGLEQAEGKRFLVLELVEGETLTQRLDKGPLPLEEVLEVCRQIAEGLEAAHEKGVIHRDLKPSNVMITAGDKVKILDFGLAKALSDETQSIDSSQSPTLTEAMTRPGVILGTAAYMSPEQAKGKAIDKRADIWAFGCILYECLTGKRAFEGETVTETLASVLTKEPEWEKVPAKVRPLLRRCLEKDPKKRARDIGEAMAWIEIAPEAVPLKRPWLAWGVAAALLMALLLLVFLRFHEQAPSAAGLVKFQIPLPDKASLTEMSSFALSPDGRHLAFAATDPGGVQRLWLRSFDSLEARPLPGTERNGFLSAFWSPDSRFIAFDAGGGKLKKIDISGGSPLTLCDMPGQSFVGGAWNRDGEIIFGTYGGGIMRVSAAGGTASALTTLNQARQEMNHVGPVFLPDGRHFLYFCKSGILENTGIYVGSLDVEPKQQSSKRLIPCATFGVCYIPSRDTGPGYLLYQRGQALVAQAFDDKQLELIGEPALIVEPVGSSFEYAFFSASTNGALVYRLPIDSRLVWMDRSGRESGVVWDEGGLIISFALSKDASKLVVSRSQSNGRQNLWVTDLLRGSTARLTFQEADNYDPRWSPDNRQVIFDSTRDPARSPFKVSLPASEPAQVFKFDGMMFSLHDWSPDGRYLLYSDSNKPELWVRPLSGDQKPVLVARPMSGYSDQAQFSPDGRWIAFHTNDSGRFEVNVVPFPPTGDKWQISTAGGGQPTWRRDGRELYFLAPDATLMAVDIRPAAKFEWGEPRPLFKTPLSVGYDVEQYAPAPDGKRFLFQVPNLQGSKVPFAVILNWTTLLKK